MWVWSSWVKWILWSNTQRKDLKTLREKLSAWRELGGWDALNVCQSLARWCHRRCFLSEVWLVSLISIWSQHNDHKPWGQIRVLCVWVAGWLYLYELQKSSWCDLFTAGNLVDVELLMSLLYMLSRGFSLSEVQQVKKEKIKLRRQKFGKLCPQPAIRQARPLYTQIGRVGGGEEVCLEL